MLEFLAPGFIYSVLKDIYGLVVRRRRRLTPQQVVELRQRFKGEIEPVIRERQRGGEYVEVVIRDMKRFDEYPDPPKQRGGRIPSWFKIEVVGTYHRGIQVGMRGEELVYGSSGWRIVDYDSERGATAILIGEIPYERIERVDWRSDDALGLPTIYCYFDASDGTPYERRVFGFERDHTLGWKYYVEAATLAEVKANAKKQGTRQTSP